MSTSDWLMEPALPKEDLDLILSKTSSFWRRYRGARFLLTGGTGFIGNWLVQAVQHANDTLGVRIHLCVPTRNVNRALQIRPLVYERTDITLIGGDIASFDLPPGPIDLCLHAATDVVGSASTSDRLKLFDSIVNGTRHVLDLARERGAGRLLLTSSGAVYGPQPANISHLPETYPGAPDPLQLASAYGHGKRTAEWLTTAYAHQLETQGFGASIARIFALIGPGMPLDASFAAGNFVRDALAKKAIAVQGDGRTVRSYLYMADLCIWLLRLLEDGESGAAYNVGSERAVSILELATHTSSIAGVPDAPTVLQPLRHSEVPQRYVPDTLKARQSLHLEELTPLPLALQKTLRWARTAMTS